MSTTLRTALFMQASGGVCPTQVDEVIRGWGIYKDQVELLPSTEQDKIPQIAELIVTSFTTPGCVPLGQIAIVGHADKDFHGAAFENEKSKERGTAVAAALGKALIKAFKAHKIGHITPGAIAFAPSPTGVGSTQPDPANVPTVKDRALNRRVEIHVGSRGAPVPPKDTFERRVQRALKLLDTKGFKVDSTGNRKVRARCLLNKMLRSDVVELFVDGTQRGRKIGSQDVPGFTASFPGRYDGTPTAKPLGPALPDDQILEFLDVVVLEKIYTGILRVERYLTLQVNLFTGRYEGDRARIRCNGLYSDHFDDDNNIYNCWKGYTGGEDSHIV